MKYAYCEDDIDGRDNVIYKYQKFYHIPCYMSWVHDIATTIRLKANNIIEHTQGNNAAANSEARRIVEITEKIR